jgi:hypothetical protein
MFALRAKEELISGLSVVMLLKKHYKSPCNSP